MRVARNKVVTIHYTLTDSEGRTLDTSVGGDPMAYVHGVGALIPGLETALEGRSGGDSIKVSVGPEDGYGVRNELLVRDLPRTSFGKRKPDIGMQIRLENPGQEPRLAVVVDVKPDLVRVDGNHPLAGRMLHFDVQIISVRDATKDEIAHRHAHGPGGHPHH